MAVLENVSEGQPALPMLITGVAGVPGYNAFHYFRSLYGEQVIGVRQPTMWPLKGAGLIGCDLESRDAVSALWDKYQFGSVLNSAGSCRLKSCELDPTMAHRVNVLGTENVAMLAKIHGSYLLHLSIDLVFGGRPGGGYVETDEPDPVTIYGAKMVEAERFLFRTLPDACVLRISLPMGISFNGHAGAIDWIASRFRQNKPATLYFDEVRTPKYTDCMNHLFHRLMVRRLPGLFHAGGNRKLSLFEIAQIVNVVGGYDPNLLYGCPRMDAGPMPPRAGDVTLNSEKLCEVLGGNPYGDWPHREDYVPDSQSWHHDLRLEDGGETLVNSILYRNPNRPGLVPPNRNALWGSGRFN